MVEASLATGLSWFVAFGRAADVGLSWFALLSLSDAMDDFAGAPFDAGPALLPAGATLDGPALLPASARLSLSYLPSLSALESLSALPPLAYLASFSDLLSPSCARESLALLSLAPEDTGLLAPALRPWALDDPCPADGRTAPLLAGLGFCDCEPTAFCFAAPSAAGLDALLGCALASAPWGLLGGSSEYRNE